MPELTPQPTPIQAIYDMYRFNTLIVNRSYQRKLVWTLPEKRKLIDSLISRFPIPLILLSESRYGDKPVYEVIDGLQRLHTIVSFIENKFCLEGGEYFDIDQFSAAKNAAQAGKFVASTGKRLNSHDCASILNYVLSFSVMRDASSEQIQDVFHRINSYGHRLSEQERRQAGLVTRLSQFVRRLACKIRGDDSKDILLLSEMPAISIDLPKSKHGFGIEAKDCFWVKHGILRSTDLRDSMDEHLIADIACCIVNGVPIERSVDTLDEAFDINTSIGKSIEGALITHGEQRLGDEIFYVLSEIEKVVEKSIHKDLRCLIFKATQTNPYPSVFSLIFLAFYKYMFVMKKRIIDYENLAQKLNNISNNIDTGRGAVVVSMRETNINCVVGIIEPAFGEEIDEAGIYGAPSIVEFENIIRNSPIENAALEFKQGLSRLREGGELDLSLIKKIFQTVCAIANISPKSSGHIFIGVADNKKDADKAASIDSVLPIKIAERYVVGIDREAKRLSQTIEIYFTRFRELLRASSLSDPLKQQVLSCMRMIDYHGRVVLDIGIPSQSQLSFFEGQVYFREADQQKVRRLRRSPQSRNNFHDRGLWRSSAVTMISSKTDVIRIVRSSAGSLSAFILHLAVVLCHTAARCHSAPLASRVS